jgi:hypothetical protein
MADNRMRLNINKLTHYASKSCPVGQVIAIILNNQSVKIRPTVKVVQFCLDKMKRKASLLTLWIVRKGVWAAIPTRRLFSLVCWAASVHSFLEQARDGL